MSNFNYINTTSINTTLPPTESPSYQNFLDTVVRNSDVILLDTSTVMKGESFEALMRQLVPILRKYQRQIVVLQPVLKEVRSLSTSLDAQVRDKAAHALEGLNALSYGGIVCFRGNPNETSTGKEGILKYVMKNVWEQNLLILSQAADLAADCRFFQQIRSTKLQHTVQIKRLSNQYGQLKDFLAEPTQPAQPAQPVQAAVYQPVKQQAPANNAQALLKRYGI